MKLIYFFSNDFSIIFMPLIQLLSMKKITSILFLFVATISTAQIQGNITDLQDNPLSFVSIYLDGTVTGTTSNDNGDYILELKKTGKYTVFFQFLGFKTMKKEVTISKFPFILNVKMEEENISLKEISISTKENPALAIIRNTIANKEKNTDKLAKYTAKFYSRGLTRIKDAPKSFMGQNLGDFGGGLDSTRSGIIYLSETFSNISFQKKPKKFKEKIVASKVAGQDNGVSFNRAEDSNLDLYENSLTVFNGLISPISSNAFSYYNYKLVGSFYENGKLINKINLIPKRKGDRVFEGSIYIVENDWALYGVDVTATGEQVNIPIVNSLKLKQSFNYSEEIQGWILINQTIDFDISIFGFKPSGKFSYAYSDYNFKPQFTETTFTNEVLSFAENATEKDSLYWNSLRPVPLTKEEVTDYRTKDSIKVIRKSKQYLDSVDTIRNKFKIASLLTSYRYRNSYEDWSLTLSSPAFNTSFNTVQGFNSTAGIAYFSAQNDQGKWWNVNANVNYGFADERVRPTLSFARNWNNISRPYLSISGGTQTAQFNGREPISSIYNSFYSLLDRKNYLKIYEKTFAKISYSEELFNGFRFNGSVEYQDRNPLFNSSNYSWVTRDYNYTSNNPIDVTNFSASFNQHTIWSASVGANIVFGQQYLSYPDQKFNIGNEKYPQLYVGYRKNFGASNSDLNSDLFFAKLNQNINLGAFGEFKYNVRAGIFTEKKDIAFMDYLHPNGNQLQVVNDSYTDSFGILEYYKFSTNDKYSEMHVEHNFKGFLLSKIPLVNKLGFHLVGGAKGLFTADTKPYTEYSVGLDNIGYGKWRFLRIDYVLSNYNGTQSSGWLFGLSLF